MVYSMPDLEVVWKSLVISVSSPFLQLFTAVLVLFFYTVPKYYSTRLTSCVLHIKHCDDADVQGCDRVMEYGAGLMSVSDLARGVQGHCDYLLLLL